MLGGDISVPVPRKNEDIKKSLKIGEFTREVEEKCTPRQMKELLMKYERTKHFMIWADNSTIMNHGHIIYLVQCLYDPAFSFTPEEMKARWYENVVVPSIIDRPHLYIPGRCGSKEIEQLAYVDTRTRMPRSTSPPCRNKQRGESK